MKTVALDIGNKWTGSAISDALGMFARPYKTVATKELEDFITQLLKTETISTIVIGYPKTMKGKESEQTKKTTEKKKLLEKKFTTVAWKLWDERLSSKRAASAQRSQKKTDKNFSHSIAAAFILDSYLTYQTNLK